MGINKIIYIIWWPISSLPSRWDFRPGVYFLRAIYLRQLIRKCVKVAIIK